MALSEDENFATTCFAKVAIPRLSDFSYLSNIFFGSVSLKCPLNISSMKREYYRTARWCGNGLGPSLSDVVLAVLGGSGGRCGVTGEWIGAGVGFRRGT